MEAVKNTVERHAKHPKASLAFGICTLCWSLLAALFMFSGGVAVYNLSVYDAYYSGALSPSATVYHSKDKAKDYDEAFNGSPQPVGSIMNARNIHVLKNYVSKAGINEAFYLNKSRTMCFGGDASYQKSLTDPDTKCKSMRIFQPTW
eukprot:g3287.t1